MENSSDTVNVEQNIVVENQEQETVIPEDATVNSDNTTIPKARLDKEIQKRKEIEETVSTLVSELSSDIPEEYRSLIPNLPPAEQIKWIRQAQKAGIFNDRIIVSPDSKRVNTQKQTDYSHMDPISKIANGYGK